MIRVLFAAACLLCTLIAPSFAQSPKPPDRGAVTHQETVATPAPKPAPVPLKPFEQVGLIRTSSGLHPTRLANGATIASLEGRYREFVVVSVDASGTPRIGCLHDARALQLLLQGRLQAVSPRYEEK